LLASALATARELGMDGLVAKMRGLGLEAAATVGGQEPADGDAVFRHEGDFWTVAYAGKAVRLRHGKGLGDIAILLANPGKEIHVADLIAASASAPPDPRSGPAAELVAQGLRVSRDVSGDTVLDRRARADYRERLADLHRELDDAERCNDEGRLPHGRGPRKGGFLMSARLTAIAIAVLVTAAPGMAQTPQRPIGDIQVFATLPYPGHPGGLAVDGRTVFVDTSNADFDRPLDASDEIWAFNLDSGQPAGLRPNPI